ncbi:MAG: hypothetical protein QNJ98_20600 [Planctomycetota bacterium]|nr:hypothetical protein [Planctomycetota bacterium]
MDGTTTPEAPPVRAALALGLLAMAIVGMFLPWLHVAQRADPRGDVPNVELNYSPSGVASMPGVQILILLVVAVGCVGAARLRMPWRSEPEGALLAGVAATAIASVLLIQARMAMSAAGPLITVTPGYGWNVSALGCAGAMVVILLAYIRARRAARARQASVDTFD